MTKTAPQRGREGTSMIERVERMAERYDEITAQMADPDVLANPQLLQELARERAELEDAVERYRAYGRLQEQIEDARSLVEGEDDAALVDLARDEIAALQPKADALLAELRELLTPRDPNDSKDVIVEIRAG